MPDWFENSDQERLKGIYKKTDVKRVPITGIVAGYHTLPFTLAGLLLIPAALSAFSIREHTYSARAQGGPATINAVDTTTTPSPPSPVIAHLKTRS